MTVFAYKAVDRHQDNVRGVISADTPDQARERLREEGLRVREMVPSRHDRALRLPWSRVGAARLAMMIRELATLLTVGIPLAEALAVLARQYRRNRLHLCLMELREEICSGRSLAESMANHPTLFDSLTTRMVEVGEQSGNLASVLHELADYRE